ncbi:hypothetical protein lam_655 [Candidatus Liberibacter americanus str. Sao Paulo]|uniref:Uncharacterized protein n=1 Tax=Candidatus Liberibacter americanus str. Sao Paulo TaxID=1261131 RepID=U6B815_9HYPH|nr:hypothetical protein [Candidatus Liberibacter americanus]AHA28001.1 hypothetical protein lam_655 [Candidatus Liberibacter americanus str. Sao Paulo]
MGKVSQHYMEQIENNYDFNSLNNPRYGIEPEPDYAGEIIDYLKKIPKMSADLMLHRDIEVKKEILSLLYHRLDHLKCLVSKHSSRLSEEIKKREEFYYQVRSISI